MRGWTGANGSSCIQYAPALPDFTVLEFEIYSAENASRLCVKGPTFFTIGVYIVLSHTGCQMGTFHDVLHKDETGFDLLDCTAQNSKPHLDQSVQCNL